MSSWRREEGSAHNSEKASKSSKTRLNNRFGNRPGAWPDPGSDVESERRCRTVGQVTGLGLEPRTSGLTYPFGFHRPQLSLPFGARPSWSLDSPFTIAGVPRRVSEAGPGDPPEPLPADYPIPHAFQTVTFAVAGCRCGGAGSQGVPAYCGIHSQGSVSSRGRLPFARQGRRRSPLLYRLSYPV